MPNMKQLFLLLAFVAGTQWASAQMTKWTWDQHRIEFQAPKDFKVSKNDKTVFSAGNTNIALTIYPRSAENMGYDEMAGALEKWAISSKLNYDMAPEYLDDLNGYWGCYIDGYGSNGNPTTVLLLVDPDFADKAFYVWIQYQDGYLERAVEILRSFTPI